MVFYRVETVFENHDVHVLQQHIAELDLRVEWDGHNFDKLEDVKRYPMKT
jgi:hypothetical protein